MPAHVLFEFTIIYIVCKSTEQWQGVLLLKTHRQQYNVNDGYQPIDEALVSIPPQRRLYE